MQRKFCLAKSAIGCCVLIGFLLLLYLFLLQPNLVTVDEDFKEMLRQHYQNQTFAKNNSTILQKDRKQQYNVKEKTIPQKENMILFYLPKWWEQEVLKRNNPFEKCLRRCKLSADNKDINHADVVIFLVDTLKIPKLPVKQANQIWVLAQYESPDNMRYYGCTLNSQTVLEAGTRKINWTMGYRRDSDFVVTHGRFVLRKNNSTDYLKKLDKLMKTKKKASVWLNSHCPTIGKREEFGRLLQKHMQLDIFGTCGKTPKKCDPKNRFLEAFGFSKDGFGQCVSFIEKEYKYYMSFENTLCLDYVTEKSLQKYMAYFLVPVVRAHINSTLFHPPGSVIDASQFTSTQSLAKHINSINDETYRTFYSWKKHYAVENVNSMWLESICNICERSYEPHKYSRLYENIYDWVWKPRGDVCKPVSDLQ